MQEENELAAQLEEYRLKEQYLLSIKEGRVDNGDGSDLSPELLTPSPTAK